ncbi:MAG: hypothetical protein ACTSUY_02760 [Alphaproteobacteria bacterium]
MLEQASRRWAASTLKVHEGPFWLVHVHIRQLGKLGAAFALLETDIGALVTGATTATALLPQRLWRPSIKGLETEGFSGPYSVVEISADPGTAAEAGFLAPAIARLALADIAVHSFTAITGVYLAVRTDDAPQVKEIISLLIKESLVHNSAVG